jgi:hypothetical protein
MLSFDTNIHVFLGNTGYGKYFPRCEARGKGHQSISIVRTNAAIDVIWPELAQNKSGLCRSQSVYSLCAWNSFLIKGILK